MFGKICVKPIRGTFYPIYGTWSRGTREKHERRGDKNAEASKGKGDFWDFGHKDPLPSPTVFSLSGKISSGIFPIMEYTQL